MFQAALDDGSEDELDVPAELEADLEEVERGLAHGDAGRAELGDSVG